MRCCSRLLSASRPAAPVTRLVACWTRANWRSGCSRTEFRPDCHWRSTSSSGIRLWRESRRSPISDCRFQIERHNRTRSLSAICNLQSEICHIICPGFMGLGREDDSVPNDIYVMVKDTQRAVVLLSGGMDSCVCAALAARDHDAAAVHVSYGQRTEEREQRAVFAICDRLRIRDQLLVRERSTLPDWRFGADRPQYWRSRIARYRTRYSGNLCAVPQRPLPLGGGELGGSAGRGSDLHWRGGAGQFGLS